MIYDLCEKIIKDLRTERLAITDAIIQGFHNPDAYKFACGKINGLERAAQLIKTKLEQEMKNDGN